MGFPHLFPTFSPVVSGLLPRCWRWLGHLLPPHRASPGVHISAGHVWEDPSEKPYRNLRNFYIILWTSIFFTSNSYDIYIYNYTYLFPWLCWRWWSFLLHFPPGNPETAGAKPRLDDVAYRETLPGLIEKNGGTISVYQCLLVENGGWKTSILSMVIDVYQCFLVEKWAETQPHWMVYQCLYNVHQCLLAL